MRSIIEIFTDGQWLPAAEFEPVGAGPYTGSFAYLIDYVFGPAPVPISFTLPVDTTWRGVGADGQVSPCPGILLDLVPQGRGRQALARELALPDNETTDLQLAQWGAFNPIGNLRLDTAVRFYETRRAQQLEAPEGFALEALLARRDEALSHLWLHALLTAGTTGVQGAASKFLLTQRADGLWFADAALPDAQAARHWLVKLPRGAHETDYTVLRNEAAYLRVAARCGLRSAGEAHWQGDMLFAPRFDRRVVADGVQRLHQESLAALAGLRGFGVPASLFSLVAAFVPHVTDPAGEMLEFLRRDILNLALRNPDNHARNTAVQRLPDGTVQLTPVFDFAPMYLDRELIVRGCHWRIGNSTLGPPLQAWAEILGHLPDAQVHMSMLAQGLRDFLPKLERLPETMRECGVEMALIDDCRQSIDVQVRRLEELRHG